MTRSRIASFSTSLGVFALLCAGAPIARAANFSCTWTDASDNWTTTGDWSGCNGTFPNNGGGNTFDASISTGDPTLTTAVTVGSVTVNSLGAWTVTGAGASATLTGLSSNAGSFVVVDGASVTTIGVGLTNTGSASVDGINFGGSGGSSLTLGGALTNSAGATFDIGNLAITASSTVQATSLSNAGAINLVGNGAAAPAKLTIAGGLTNTGSASVDAAVGGSGGSSLTLGGTLDNDTGALAIGNTALGASTNVTAAALSNTGGSISIVGNTTLGTTNQASLEVAASAPSTSLGNLLLEGDALLQFTGTSSIQTIGTGTTLELVGPQARVALSSSPTTNSALTGLSSNAGSFVVVDGASVTTIGVGLTNTGSASVDGINFGGSGGSSLTLGGALTNSAGATFDIGNLAITASSTVQATSLSNAGAINLVGNGAAAPAKLTIAGGLTNTGSASVDAAVGGSGGSSLTLGGTLDNDTGALAIGNTALGASTNVTAAALSNTGGSISIVGNTTLGTTNQASLEVAASAPSTSLGNLLLEGDALLQFTGTSSIQTIGTGTTLELVGPQARVALSSSPTTNSALTGLSSNAGSFVVVDGASVTTIGVGLTNTGSASVDGINFGGSGGSSLTLGGALTNSAGATFDIGNLAITASSTVQATSLSNAGAINLVGNGAAAPAKLTIAGGLTNTGSASVDAAVGGSGGSSLTLGGTLDNDTGALAIGNTALGASTNVTAAALSNTGGSISIVGNTTLGTTNQASLEVAASAPSTSLGNLLLEGDALLQFTGTSSIQTIGTGTTLELVGPQARVALSSSPTTNSALTGLSSNAGSFVVVDGASVTTIGVGLTNTGSASVDGINFGGSGGSSLTLGGALTNSAGATFDIGNLAITASSTVQATSLSNAGAINLVGNGAAAPAKLTIAGGLTNTGSASVDAAVGGSGGSSLTLGGTLDNDTGALAIGNTALGASTNVTAAALSNTGGSISIVGNTTLGTTNQASLEVAASAPSTSLGNLLLEGDALLQFTGTSSIQTIGTGTTLELVGPQARVALSSSPTTNSALTGLSSNAGSFVVVDGASVTTIGVGLTNTGSASVDGINFGGSGGSSLTLGGALTNSAGATFDIGNLAITASSTVQATSLSNAGAINLVGNGAAAPAKLTIAGGLTNTGSASVDAAVGGSGGSSLTLGGTLDNDTGALAIGNTALGASTNVTAAALSNTGGSISIVGNTTLGTTNQASLEVAASAPSTSLGNLLLEGDALLQFTGTSSIQTIGTGTTLELVGPQARVALSSSPTTNSALTGLSSNAGSFVVVDGASVTTIGVGLTNTGSASVDGINFGGSGGSSLTLGGALTNSAGATFDIGNLAITASSTVQATSLSNAGAINLVGNGAAAPAKLTIAGGLTNTGSASVDAAVGGSGGSSLTLGGTLDNDTGALAIGNTALGASTNVTAAALSNTGGSISIVGNTTLGTTNQASLEVAASAPSTSLGNLLLEGDALLQFTGTSSIQTIGTGTTLELVGPQARVALSSSPTTNSALTGLSSNAGSFVVVDGASVTTIGVGLTNTGSASVDGINFGGSGGSSLTLGGALTNSAGATFDIGNLAITASSTVQATSLSNAGAINLVGNGAAAPAKLTIAGGLTNTGSASVDAAVGGSGGSSLTLGGTLDNDTGALAIGNTALGASTNVTAAALSNTGGTINMVGGSATNVANLTVNGAAGNAGTADIGAFSNLNVTGAGNAYTQTAGTTTIVSGGTLTAPNVNLVGGTLQGNGVVAGTLNVSATGTVEAINPSTANADTLTVSGAYHQSGGTLAALLQGTGAGQVGTVAVASGNSVKLTGGNLTSAPGSIAYAAGQTFSDVMTFQPGQLFGTFTQLQGLGNGVSANLGGGLTLEAFYNNSAGNISLGVISTPATTGFTWTDATGSWDTASDWSGNAVPTPVADVTIGSTSTGNVTLTHDATINSLTINASNALTTTAGTLTVGANVTDSGSLTLGGSLNLPGTVTVNSGGTLGLSGGTIIDATLAGTGTVQTNIGNSGTLHAVTISSGSTYTGGTGSTTTLLDTLTNKGTLLINGAGQAQTFLQIGNDMTLSGGGTVNLTVAGGVSSSFLRGSGVTLTNVDNTIQGAGFIGDSGALTLVNQATVNANSSGQTLNLGGGGGSVTNTGTLEAANSGTLKIVSTTVNNAGGNITTADAASSAQLSGTTIQGGTLNNTNGGTMETAIGSSATLDSTTAAGAVTINGTYTGGTGSTTTLLGAITNNGTIQLNGAGQANTFLQIGSNTTLSGGGTVNLTGASGVSSSFLRGSGVTLTNVNNTIQGEGFIGDSGALTFINQATVDANDSSQPLNINGGNGGVTNTGLLEATNGGTLQLLNTIANAGGNITVADAASTVQLNGATIQGGTLNNTSGGTMATVNTANNTALDGSTAAGAVTINGTYTGTTGTTTILRGAITNNGTIQLNGAGQANTFLSIGNTTTLSGGGTVNLTVASGVSSSFLRGSGVTLTNTNNTIQGAGFIGDSGALNFVNGTAGTLLANVSGQTLSVGGGGGTVTNNGVFAANNGGTLTATVPFTNTGTVDAINGTINANQGFTGTTGTAQIDAAGKLSIGANSTVGTLTHNGSAAGSLNLGANNITVSTDYNNDNFGTGNSFNKLANVATTGGQILAAGPIPANMQVITSTTPGAVTGGNTPTPTLTLSATGNVHVGDSVTYQIANQGTAANPSLRGAIQTTVNGGNINPALLTGSGVTAANFGPLVPGSSTSNLTVTAASAGSFSGQAIHIANNFGNVPAQTIGITGAAYALASPTVTSSLSPQFNFGVVIAGQTYTDPLTITNTLVASTAAFQEGLNASFGSPTNTQLATDGGMITNLTAGTSNSTTMSVSLTPTAAGTVAGTVPISFASNGATTSGLGITSLAGQNLNYNWIFMGTVVNPASPSITPTTINFGNVRIDTTQQQALSVTNMSTTAPQASLDAQISAVGPATSNGGAITQLLADAPANTTSLIAGLSTANAGARSGTATVALQSDSTPNGCTSDCIADLPSQPITVTGNVFRLATGSATSPVSLGNVRINTALSGNLSVTNTAANDGFSENLDAAISATTPDITGSSGSVSGLAAGLTNSTGLSVTLGSSSAGAKSGTATVQFQSDGTGIDGGAPVDNGSQTVTVTGNVFRLATGSATSPQDIGAARVGIGTFSGNLSVTNTAANDGFSENLDATITATTPDATGSSGQVTGLAAGQTNSTGLNVTLNNSTAGSKSGTATVQFQSDGAGIDGGAPIDNGSQNVTVTGNVYTPAVANVLTTSPVDFGIVHVGDGGGSLAQSVTVQNGATASALNDVLTGSISAGGAPFSGSGTLGSGLGPQASSSALKVALGTGTAGVFTGTANLALASHDSQLADLVLATSPLLVSAQVNNYAALAFLKTGGQGSLSGNASSGYDLDFGSVLQGSTSPQALLAFLNDHPLAEQAFTDLLSSTGSIAPPPTPAFTIVGDSVSGLAGGDSQGGFDVSFDTSMLGNFDEMLSFDVGSSNSSGYNEMIGDVTLNLEGDVVKSPVPEPATIPLLASGLGILFFVVRRQRRRR